MRVFAILCVVTFLADPVRAQQASQNQAPDLTKAAHVSAADLAARVAKQPADRNGFITGLLQFQPYSVNIEHRVAVPQAATAHETEGELFYIIDGAATLVTGGKLIEPARNGANLSSTKGVEGGVAQKLSKGDFVMVPAGMPHWFTEIQGSVTVMALHLPIIPPAK